VGPGANIRYSCSFAGKGEAVYQKRKTESELNFLIDTEEAKKRRSEEAKKRRSEEAKKRFQNFRLLRKRVRK
jgi:hypothetical protein